MLELGCGNGRILLPLAARGFGVTGVDASSGMLAELRRKAAMQDLAPRALQADVRSLSFGAQFGIVLCPYSLVTYLVGDDDLSQLVAGVRRALLPGGVLVVDAFVPRVAVGGRDFRQDYRRPYGGLTLVRSKRITPLPGGFNRIERRYEEVAADGAIVDRVEVAETIRPFAPEELVAALERLGLRIRHFWWDYGACVDADNAQYFTVEGSFDTAD